MAPEAAAKFPLVVQPFGLSGQIRMIPVNSGV